MRTGYSHLTISPLSIRDARLPSPLPNPSSGSMDMRASDSVVKSPDLAVAICRATFPRPSRVNLNTRHLN